MHAILLEDYGTSGIRIDWRAMASVKNDDYIKKCSQFAEINWSRPSTECNSHISNDFGRSIRCPVHTHESMHRATLMVPYDFQQSDFIPIPHGIRLLKRVSLHCCIRSDVLFIAALHLSLLDFWSYYNTLKIGNSVIGGPETQMKDYFVVHYFFTLD